MEVNNIGMENYFEYATVISSKWNSTGKCSATKQCNFESNYDPLVISISSGECMVWLGYKIYFWFGMNEVFACFLFLIILFPNILLAVASPGYVSG